MVGKKLFYLYKRNNIYYVQLKNPRTGKPLPARSTGQSNKEKAEYIARKWIFEGLPESTDQLKSQDSIHAVDEALSIIKETKNLSKQDVKRFLHYFKSKGFLADYTLAQIRPLHDITDMVKATSYGHCSSCMLIHLHI